MRWGTVGKAFDQDREEIGHRVKRPMVAEACIMFELQQRQVIGKAAGLDPPGGLHPIEPEKWHKCDPAQIEPKLAAHGDVAMRTEMSIAHIQEHHEPMVERAIEDMLPHIPPF